MQHVPFAALALFASLQPWAWIGAQAPAPTTEELAQTQLERAEEFARSRRFSDARNLYQKIAKDFPATSAGAEALERTKPSAYLGWADVVRNGPSKNRVDIVLMGDGYELEHLRAFDKLAEDIPPLFERQETLREYYPYFNFLRAILISQDSGVDGFGREYDTALNGHTTGTFAGHVGIDGNLVRGVMRKIPDTDGQAIVFVKNGVLGTGGGGIATIGGREVRTVIHEFGHSFGRLSDEYQTQQSHGQGADVRNTINVAASEDPTLAPWKHWIEAKHPSVGMYEGAAGRPRGAWRATASGCLMDSDEKFCVVCREALVLRIYSIVDPIEDCAPPAQGALIEESYTVEDSMVFQVDVMKPATHTLDVSWWLIPEPARPPRTGGEARPRSKPETKVPRAMTAADRDRTKRGVLPPLTDEPVREVRGSNDTSQTFEVRSNGLAAGRYRLICRVKDTTQLRGERFPWVLSDPMGLLESERAWWIEIPFKR